MTKKCGSIFNRHKWVHPFDVAEVQICSKCGECQHYVWQLDSWQICSLDTLLEDIDYRKKLDKDDKDSRREALKYLKEHQND